MGWFINTNTEARQYNNNAMLSLLANIDHKGQTLVSYHNQATDTIELLEHASAMTQQSSELGQQLAHILTPLKTHSTELAQQIEATTTDFLVATVMLAQYKLPRIKRKIGMSGDAMAGFAILKNTEVQVGLRVIENIHTCEMIPGQRMLNELSNQSQTH